MQDSSLSATDVVARANAHARLIAAAPDLLAALIEYTDAMDAISDNMTFGDEDERPDLDAAAELAYRHARAAIAKATGDKNGR